MNKEKAKRLKAQGWNITNVQEFLDLSEADMAEIELRLVQELKSARALIESQMEVQNDKRS